MLIISSIDRAPIKLDQEYRGAKLTISVRPLDAEIRAEIRDKTEDIYRFAKNPVTGTMELGSVPDQDGYISNLYDYMIADFSGIGKSEAEPWPVNKKTKMQLIRIAPGPQDKKSLDAVITEASEKLAADRRAALEAERKNS